MKLKESSISGCYELLPKVFLDERGTFVKTFHEDIFRDCGLEANFAEEYYSVSYKNVIRGLHFQLPPKEHTKIVYCVQGSVQDVVVDLRTQSPTYGKFEIFSLSAEKANMVYIPIGLAHGFEALSETAIMLYKVSTVYSPKHDTGILWNSVNISWQTTNPIVSKRDQDFQLFTQFVSPFTH
jgi:dTDP-4-dehydrorhamnose 3,5-epimerase